MFFNRNPDPVKIKLLMDRYIKDLIEYIQDLDVEDPIGTAEIFIKRTRQHQESRIQILQDAISRIDPWYGSQIIIKPHYFANSWRSYSAYASDPFEPVLSTNVTLIGPKSSGSICCDPEFTWFSDNDIDDVIDVGDPDFFLEPKVQSDYFSLIRELRSPGSTQQRGKVMTLFTARPVSDRARYLGAQTIPVGIFLANAPGHVSGIALDLAEGNVPRDIYKVRIYQKYLILSQDLGLIKYYQTIGDQEVPVLSINLY